MYVIRRKDGTTLFVPTRQDHPRAKNVPGLIPAGRPLSHPTNFVVSTQANGTRGYGETTLTSDYLPYSLEDAEAFFMELEALLERGKDIFL